MKTKKPFRCLGILVLFLVLLAAILGGLLLFSGKSSSLRNQITHLPGSAISFVVSQADHANVLANNHGQLTNIIFLHHSVGQGIISQGDLRGKLSQAGFTFYDHGYNDTGLTKPDGQPANYSYRVPGDNTDIDGLVTIFKQTVYPLPINTLSDLFQHEVIIVKSCFPNNHITSDEQLALDQSQYLEIKDVMQRHPEKLFIILTSPPLNPAETNADEAGRARMLESWLASDQFIGDAKNIYVFDLFNALAEKDGSSPDANMLRTDYREGSDSHPNQTANEKIAGMLAEFIEESVKNYKESAPAG
jgi:hypothetical protein